MTKERHLGHGSAEASRHQIVVGSQCLPVAGSPGITGQTTVAAHPELSRDGRELLSKGKSAARSEGSVQGSLDVELGIEDLRSRVEGAPEDGGVQSLLGGQAVSGQKVNELLGSEASIGHTAEHSIDGVTGAGDEGRRGGLGVLGTTSQELETGGTSTVRHSDCSGELNDVTEGDTVPESSLTKSFDGGGKATICGECKLDVRMLNDGTISSSSSEDSLGSQRVGKANGVMENDAKDLANGAVALASLVEVSLEVRKDIVPNTAGGRSSVSLRESEGTEGDSESGENDRELHISS